MSQVDEVYLIRFLWIFPYLAIIICPRAGTNQMQRLIKLFVHEFKMLDFEFYLQRKMGLYHEMFSKRVYAAQGF